MAEYTQHQMVHPLPAATLVDRVPHLLAMARGRRVIHIGFVDSGCRQMQDANDAWLHEHLDDVATSLVGIDIDPEGVAEAQGDGYESYAVDACDPDAVAALSLEPAELVVAGEVIEHLSSPGGMLEAAQALVAPGGRLVVTTPNGHGLINTVANLARREVNHPDHVVIFSHRTLAALAARHGWEVEGTWVYVPVVKSSGSGGVAARALEGAARATCALERGLARIGRPYAADGLIVTLRSTRS